MNKFRHSGAKAIKLINNPAHKFAMNHSMMIYSKNALYSFIPKNACSTLRLTTAINNGCIDNMDEGHWIHNNNGTFNATLGEAIKADYTFVILRCPYHRLASVFLDKIVSKEPDAWNYRSALGRKIELDDISFRDFVLSLRKGLIFNSNTHWRKQCDFLLFKEYTDYFCLENFNEAIDTLKRRIDLDIVDARSLTNHGTEKYILVSDGNYSDTPAFDISVMKRQGFCPSHKSLYDQELYDIVSELYSQDIELYVEKFTSANLMSL